MEDSELSELLSNNVKYKIGCFRYCMLFIVIMYSLYSTSFDSFRLIVGVSNRDNPCHDPISDNDKYHVSLNTVNIGFGIAGIVLTFLVLWTSAVLILKNRGNYVSINRANNIVLVTVFYIVYHTMSVVCNGLAHFNLHTSCPIYMTILPLIGFSTSITCLCIITVAIIIYGTKRRILQINN